ncbi:MAG TPA: extracellular solute-binding protein [Candidatus Sulfomarinibacteraceae bacterium]|nr:extracellular solute-binding protein [Candidatus Sulfomarinibacteraceae bacterium]
MNSMRNDAPQQEQVRRDHVWRPRRSVWRLVLLAVLWFAGAMMVACVPDLMNPPRLEQGTTPQPVEQEPPEEPLRLPAPTPTGPAAAQPNAGAESASYPTVTFWINRTSPQYEQALREMIDEFTASHQVHVELVTIAPDTLPDLVGTAAVSPSLALPDLVMLPLEYAVGWVERDILDPTAAEELVQALGPETFDPQALELVTVQGQVSAVPSDGWQQLLIYRQDWFEANGLPPPQDFNTMLRASEVISDRANLIYSFNMPTESSLPATTRAFEQMAIANGCRLIDEKGELQILEGVCRDALEFYRFICNTYCPPGVQTEVSALNAYLEGRSGLIIAPPGVLPALASLDDTYRPSCAQCETPTYLAENSGIVTTIAGRQPGASAQNLGEIAYLGVTTNADREPALALARFWFEEGYLSWLAVEPERKVPMRLGTPEEPQRFIDAWYDLPISDDGRTISDIFGREVAETLARDVVNSDRWGYKEGHGALVTTIYEQLTFSILLQELLSGYYDSERAAIEGYRRLVDLIPDYAYYVDPEATPDE